MQRSPGSAGGVAHAIDELDLGAFRRALWRRKILIVGLTLLAAAVAVTAVNVVAPRYKSEARVLIETHENIFLRSDAERSGERGATVDQEAITSQVQLILSRGLALDVIRKLKLADKPEFDPVLRGPSTIRTWLGWIGIVKDPMTQTPEERVLRSYMDRLVAFQVDKSRVISIEFESQDPELAAEVVNAIADSFLVMQQVARQGQSRDAAQFYANEVEKLRKSLADAEAKVERYRSNTNLLIGTNNTTLSGQQLGDINAQVAAARAQRADADSKARIIREALRRGAAGDVSDVMNSEQLRRLSEQHTTLRAQLAEQSATLLEQHPRIKELRAQISVLERQMRSEAERIARAFENDAAGAAARLQSLSATLDQLKKQAASSNAEDVKLRALEREAKSQRDLLESWLARYREAIARDNIGASSPEARIISRGFVSNTPSWPKKLPIVLVAAFGMFMVAVGFVLTGQLMSGAPPALAFAPASFDPAPFEPEPFEPATARAVARVLAREAAPVPEAEPPVAAPATTSAVDPVPQVQTLPAAAPPAAAVPALTIDTLVSVLGSAGESGRRIAVVGMRRNVGTTRTAIALARALATQGRTVLVDLALESPNLAAIASDVGMPGLSELVQGSASFGQIITRDRYSPVHLITLGRGQVGGDAVLASPRFSVAIEALSRSYDHVVLDVGALPGLAPERLAKLVSHTVLVVDDISGPATAAVREHLLAADFPHVSVLAGVPYGPESNAGDGQAAA
jgi:tyrosine-protein kinase Etk/Wzc